MKKISLRISVTCGFLLLCSSASNVTAEDAAASALSAQPVPAVPAEPVNAGSPRATMATYMGVCHAGNFPDTGESRNGSLARSLGGHIHHGDHHQPHQTRVCVARYGAPHAAKRLTHFDDSAIGCIRTGAATTQSRGLLALTLKYGFQFFG
jgi:hypothetical protein